MNANKSVWDEQRASEKATIEAFVLWLRNADVGADLVYKYQNDRGDSVSDDDLASYIELFVHDEKFFTRVK